MARSLPDWADPIRLAEAGRQFQGELPLSAFPRLAASLSSTQGSVRFGLNFGVDANRIPHVHAWVEGDLPLECQRTLRTFAFSVSRRWSLGLIERESQEAGLPENYEPLLITENNCRLPEIIEDELILALPMMPVDPSSEPITAPEPDASEDAGEDNPFAVLKTLKKGS